MAKTKTPPAPPVKPHSTKHLRGKARTLSSKTVYAGKIFTVTTDMVEEPGGVSASRDVIRHNGSAVILAVDHSRSATDPDVLLVRQYRHATAQFMYEIPAGRLEPGESLIPGAKRELIEETGYRAKKWSRLVRYFASPGFLSEAMNVLLAQELTLGDATPEDDERISLHMTPLSEAVRLIQTGKILDGKTIVAVLLYHSLQHQPRPARS